MHFFRHLSSVQKSSFSLKETEKSDTEMETRTGKTRSKKKTKNEIHELELLLMLT